MEVIKANISCFDKRSGKSLGNNWFEFPVTESELLRFFLGEDIEDDEEFFRFEINEYELPYEYTADVSIDYLNEIAELYLENEDNDAIDYLGYLVDTREFSNIKQAFEEIDSIIVHNSSMEDVVYNHAIAIYGDKNPDLDHFDFDMFVSDLQIEGTFIEYRNDLILEIQ